jgi:Ni,Fe-hydrogenase I cytochrome b subunit
VSSEGKRRLTFWHWVVIAIVVLIVLTYLASQGLTNEGP